MNITAHEICSALQDIKEKAPVIHNITNYVVMNSTANALLAVGASPVMAHAEEEMEEMAEKAYHMPRPEHGMWWRISGQYRARQGNHGRETNRPPAAHPA